MAGTGLNIQSPIIHPGFFAGNWYGPPSQLNSAASTFATGNINFLPWPLEALLTVDRLGICVDAIAAAGNCRVAWYNSAAPGLEQRPTTLIAQTGDISTGALGPIDAAVLANGVARPGVIHMGVQFDATAGGTAILKSLHASYNMVGSLIGAPTLAAIIIQAGSVSGFTWRYAQTYGAFPADLTGQTLSRVAGNAAGCVWARAV